MSEYNELICYKKIEIDHQGKLNFFLEKHSTKEGTWGKLTLNEGAIDFVFLNGKGDELACTRLDQHQPQLSIPPATWHKIIPGSESFSATLEFYCMRHRYFSKKYSLGSVHGDLLSVYQTYLHHLRHASILDVGCGTGRNLLYLAQLGHHVKGIDHNETALNTIQDIAEKEHLSNVHTQTCDLNQPIELKSELYDLVLSTVVLQFLNPQRIHDLLAELQETTKTGGYHFLVFPIYSDLYPMPDFFTYLPQHEALYHLYQDSGWSILEYKESMGHLHKQDSLGRKISGLFGILLAQKIK